MVTRKELQCEVWAAEILKMVLCILRESQAGVIETGCV